MALILTKSSSKVVVAVSRLWPADKAEVEEGVGEDGCVVAFFGGIDLVPVEFADQTHWGREGGLV